MESMLKIIPDRYKLVVAASKRARALNLGEKPLIDSKYKNNALIALDEIASGRVRLGGKTSSRSEKEHKRG